MQMPIKMCPDPTGAVGAVESGIVPADNMTMATIIMPIAVTTGSVMGSPQEHSPHDGSHAENAREDQRHCDAQAQVAQRYLETEVASELHHKRCDQEYRQQS